MPSALVNGDLDAAASLAESDEEAILRGEGATLTTIATTTDEFHFFGFGTSINNSGIVSNLTFCEEGLNDDGQLAFVANLDDPNAPFGFRTVVVRATLKK